METKDKSADRTALRGVLVLGSDGEQLSAGGIAAEDGMSERIAAAWRDARWGKRQVFSVEAPDGASCVVVALPTPDATVLVAMHQDSRDPLFEFTSSVAFAGELLTHFLTNPFEALTVVDREGILRYMSPVHEKFFGIQPGSSIGRHITDVVENTRLHIVAESGKTEVGVPHVMRGVTRVVTRHVIRDSAGQTVGAIGQIMFKGPDQLHLLATELTKLKSQVAYYQRELSDLRKRSYGLELMVGESPAMQRLKQQLMKVAPLDIPILLTGESGTGKELAAHAIHKLSQRRDATMVMVNAAALPSTLVESELFGYEAGSFTGAERKGRIGKIELADTGSLFFDEVGDMPAEVQVKLLRVLQDGSFQRVGGNDSRHSDFRLISASNRDFEAMIADGTFRLDLFYRIGAVTVKLPALRERLEDIPELAALALKQFAQRHGQSPKQISEEGLRFLQSQPWPGNVRQLMHVVERAAIFSETEFIEADDFGLAAASEQAESAPLEIKAAPDFGDATAARQPEAKPSQTLVSNAVEQVEEQLIREALVRYRGNKKRIATELGISRSYLYKRLGQMGLSSDIEE